MRTILLSALAFGACTSLALAESLPPAGSGGGLAAEGPVALTETQMDAVTAGLVISNDIVLISVTLPKVAKAPKKVPPPKY